MNVQPRPDIPFDPRPLEGIILSYYEQTFEDRDKDRENLLTAFRYMWSIIESRYENENEAVCEEYTTDAQILSGGAIKTKKLGGLLKKIDELTTDANCVKSTESQIDEYIERDPVERLKVRVNREYYDIYIYVRGLHEVEVQPSRLERWKALRRGPVEPKIVPKCKSLFMAVLEKPRKKEDGLLKRLTTRFYPRQTQTVQDDYSEHPTLYLNFCKDFHLWDLELLLPGACYELKWSDIGKIIWAGGGRLSVKGLLFLLKGVVSTASLPFAGVLGGFKAILSLQNLKKEQQRRGMEIAGNYTYIKGMEIIAHLVDEAERQVFGEAALAYHVLYEEYLRNESNPYLTTTEIKQRAETIVNKVYESVYKTPYVLDLHVNDALRTLEHLCVIERKSPDLWKVVNPEIGLSKLSEINDKESKQGIALNQKSVPITYPPNIDFHQLAL